MRQGLPLSPLLYILMNLSLRKRLEQERIVGNLKGIWIVHEPNNQATLSLMMTCFLWGVPLSP
jgi:hypothetical protein